MARRTGKRVRLESEAVGLSREGARRAVSAAATVGFLCGPLLMGLLVAADEVLGYFSVPLWGVALGLFFSSPLLGLAAMALSFKGDPTPGVLEVSDEGVELERGGSRRRFERAKIRRGWIVPQASGPTLELELPRGAVLSAQLRDAREGHAVLDALGLDVAQKAHVVRLGLGRRPVSLAVATAVLGAIPAAVVAAGLTALLGTVSGRGAVMVWFAVMASLVAGTQLAFRRPVVSVGSDGVTLLGRHGRRFVPHREIAGAYIDAPDVILALRDGSDVRVPTGNLGSAERDALLARVQDAWRNAQRQRAEGALELLDRRGRSFDEWRAALRALLQRGKSYRSFGLSREELLRAGKSYRSFGLSREELLRALEDPSSSAERRLGAAIALGGADEDARVRVRVAAEACAEEPVRVALGKAAADELDARSADEATRAGAAGR